MKPWIKILAATTVILASIMPAKAQYYQLANQATDMLGAILRGGAAYRGFFDVSYMKGIGPRKANFLDISTTQGTKVGNLFFMGVGAGVDVVFTEVNANSFQPVGHDYTQTSVMIPLYSDFRLNFGQPSATNLYIDLRLGAGFWVGNRYILVGDGYINSGESFYLKPTIGLRVPVSSTNSKYAINFGASYQLLTNSYWYNPNGNNNVTLSSFGVSVGFEW